MKPEEGKSGQEKKVVEPKEGMCKDRPSDACLNCDGCPHAVPSKDGKDGDDKYLNVGSSD